MADVGLEEVRRANPAYRDVPDDELRDMFKRAFPEAAPKVDAYLTVGGGPEPGVGAGTPTPERGTDWSRIAEIGGKRLGEGASAVAGLPATLAGFIAKAVESGGEEASLGQAYIRDFADRLFKMGEIPVDLWRKAVGTAPTPQGLTERTVGNVAEVAGGAAVPFLGVQGVIVGTGRSTLQAAGRQAIATAAQTGAKTQVTMLQRLAAMPPVELARVEAAMAGGAGVGRTGVETVTENPYAKLAGELVGGFGLLGARNLVSGLHEMSGSRLSRTGAEVRVGRQIADVIPPGSRAEANLGEAIQAGKEYNVQPTLSTATQSPGAATMERQVAGRIPGTAERIAERRGASELAVRESAAAIPGEGPGTVETARTAASRSLDVDRQALARTTAELQGQLAGYIDNAGKSVEAQIASMGGVAGREGAGDAIVAALKQHEASARLAAGKLFDRVDPENAVRLPTQSLRDTVGVVMKEGGESLRTDIVPPVVRNLDARLSQQSVAARLEAQGISPEVAARAGIDVAGSEDVTFNHLRRWRSDLLGELRDQASALNPNREAMRNTNRVLEAVESTLDQTANLGSDAAVKYREAAAAYRAYAEKFRQGVVADVLRRGPRGEAIRKNVEDVAGTFFKGPTPARDFIAAVGDDAMATRGLRDYAIGDFLKSAYTDGVLDTKRGAAWFKSHAEQLAKFPEVDAELRQVMKRGRTYDEVQSFVKGADSVIEKARAASLNELDRSAASAFIGADSDRAVAAVMTGQDRQQKMAELVRRMQGDETAVRGLRRAVWDHLATADFDPSLNRPMLDPAVLRQRIEDNATVLRTVYTPAQMTELRQLARVAELSVKPHAAGGAAGGQIAPTDFEARQIYTTQALYSRAWAAARWASTQFVVADAFARKVNNVFDQLSVRQLREVWSQAVLDPKVAKRLLDMGRADFNEKQMTTTLKGFTVGAAERTGRPVGGP